MNEIQNIDTNTSGEKPKGEKAIITVVDVEDAATILDNCKKAIKTLLQNSDLKPEDPKWKTLLPQNIVEFDAALTYDDRSGDDIAFSMDSHIDDFQNKNIRKWKWYSSRVTDKGFEIIITGFFNPRYIWMVHYQGIPYDKIWIESDRSGNKYQIRVIYDAAKSG